MSVMTVIRLARGWVLAFGAFFLLGAAWALVTPYAGGPDEVRQIIRAAGVAEGQIFVRPVASSAMAYTGAYQTVPSGLVRGGPPGYGNTYCYHLNPAQSASCAAVPGGPGAHVRRTYLTGNGRYNPLYYAAVGEPLVLWPDWTGILLARLISAALCAAFLASAWLSCREWRCSPMLTAGLLVAVTPALVEMSGVINPNSVEMAAGISLAAAAIPLLLDEGSPDVVRWLRRAAVAAIGIGQVRSFGPVIVGCVLAVLLIPPVRARLRYLWQLRATRWWSAGVLASCVIGAAWSVYFKAYQVAHLAQGSYTAGRILKIEVTGRLLKIVTQMIDGFPYDNRTPSLIFTVWAIALGLLLIAAFAWGPRQGRWRLTALIALTLATPVAVDIAATNTYGFSFYGRYVFAVAAGIPLLAAFIIGRSGVLTQLQQASLIRAVIVLLLPFQLISLGYMMVRWQSGVGPGHSLNPLHGGWIPVTGPGFPLLLMMIGLCVLGWLSWRAALPAADQAAVTTPSVQVLQVTSG